MSKKKCSIARCDKIIYARGYCKNHYMLWWRKGTPNLVNMKNKGMTCKIEGCKTLACTKGMCLKHYQRWRTHGSCEKKIYRGKDHWCWRGGRSQYPGHSILKKNRIIKLRQVNGKCEDCGAPANKVLRKDGSKSNHAVKNLKAVCRKCWGKNTRLHGKGKYKSKYGSVRDLAKKYGVSEVVIYQRLRKGLDPDGSGGRPRGRPKKIA